MTADDTRAKKLETVRALLAKAEGTDNEHEADAFRSKADKLMQAFAIEQWMVTEAQAGVNARPTPEIREFDYSWWSNTNHRGQLDLLFSSCARHCRCVVGYRGWTYNRMPVIGLSSDLDYLDMLFTSLMLQMVSQLEPKPDKNLSLGENAYKLRAAGIARRRVSELLAAADMLGDDAKEYFSRYNYNADKKFEQQIRSRIRKPAEAYAQANGLDGTTQMSPKVWQTSFADGFVRQLNHRMYEMRKRDEPTGNDPTALAIVDIRHQAMNVYEAQWPEPEPEPVDPDAKPRKSRAVTYRQPRFDSRAYAAGTSAGDKVNINASPQRGIEYEKPRLTAGDQ
jgi:hypothetical protein